MSWVDALKGPWLCCPYCGKLMAIRSMEREMSGATHVSSTIRMECRPCRINIFKEWSGSEMPVSLNERKPAEIHEVALTVEGRVAARIQSRAAAGLNKYGVTMERTDLSQLDWLQHAQDEALDLAVYIEKLKGMEVQG